jgi:hypothetical protein
MRLSTYYHSYNEDNPIQKLTAGETWQQRVEHQEIHIIWQILTSYDCLRRLVQFVVVVVYSFSYQLQGIEKKRNFKFSLLLVGMSFFGNMHHMKLNPSSVNEKRECHLSFDFLPNSFLSAACKITLVFRSSKVAAQNKRYKRLLLSAQVLM